MFGSAVVLALAGCDGAIEYSFNQNSSTTVTRDDGQTFVSLKRNGQEQTFSNFSQLCLSRASYADIKITIDAILKAIATPDCNQADALIPGIIELDLSDQPISSSVPLAWFRNLEILDLSNTRIDSFLHLSGLNHLTTLNVSNTPINSFIHLSSLDNLRDLNVSHTQINSFIHLPSSNNLQHLDVGYTQINSFIHLPSLSNLRYLNISYTKIDSDLHLPSLPKLERLEMQGVDLGRSQSIN